MIQQDIGNYLRQLRLEHNLTQRELARKLHITHQAVSNWEQGKALPDISILSQLGDVYGVSIDNLLLKTQETTEEPETSHIVLRRLLSFFGLFFVLFGISLFLQFDRHIVSTFIFVGLLLIPSLLYSYLITKRKWYWEYLVITVVLIIVSLVTIPKDFRYYMLEDTNYLQLTNEVEIFYPRDFDEMTQVVSYNYMFDQYALIYTEGEDDIDVFNLSKFEEVEYQTIETGMPIYDLVVLYDTIYVTTVDQDIPGEFKLYELDFETFHFTLLYESQEVLRMYEALDQLYFISDPLFEGQTKVYQYEIDSGTMFPPINLDYSVYGMSGYFVEYESFFIMSARGLDTNDQNNIIGLFDYEFELQHTLYEEDPGLVHILFTGYGHHMIGTTDGVIVFDDLNQTTLGEGYARWPKPISPEMIRVGEQLYYKNESTGEYSLYTDVLFYDQDYYPQGARFLISDETEHLYVIDNVLLGTVEPVPREIDDVYVSSGLRMTFYVIGILSYGYFLTLGHKELHSEDLEEHNVN
jgi:transcriptional regulator with XRE-family HTH domain